MRIRDYMPDNSETTRYDAALFTSNPAAFAQLPRDRKSRGVYLILFKSFVEAGGEIRVVHEGYEYSRDGSREIANARPSAVMQVDERFFGLCDDPRLRTFCRPEIKINGGWRS